MKSTLLKLFVLSLLTISSITHTAPKRIIYTGNPLKITLGVGEDKPKNRSYPYQNSKTSIENPSIYTKYRQVG